jgi:5-hydroxyisourate hydrolase-like protein (transthyretin family)
MKRPQVIEPETSPDGHDSQKLDDSLVVKHRFSINDTISFMKQRVMYVILILAALGISAYSQKPEWFGAYDTNAVSNTAQVNLQPAQISAAPNATLQLWATTSAPTGFIQVEITFTPSVMKLSSDITLVNTSLTRIIKRTPLAEANSTGKIILALGLDPAKRATPLSGSMQIATLAFAAVTPAIISSTQVTISGTATSVVGMDAALMNISATSSTISLPVPTPSPTKSPTPTPTSTPIPTPSPTTTPIPTHTPTSTPTPVTTIYPSPPTTVKPTTTPTPTITNTPTKTPTPTIISTPSPTPTPVLPELRGALTGTVLDTAKQPLANVTVVISRSVQRKYVEVARLQTDAAGQYQLSLAYGSYRIQYSARNYNSQSQIVSIQSASTEIAIYLRKHHWGFSYWFSLAGRR